MSIRLEKFTRSLRSYNFASAVKFFTAVSEQAKLVKLWEKTVYVDKLFRRQAIVESVSEWMARQRDRPREKHRQWISSGQKAKDIFPKGNLSHGKSLYLLAMKL